jgi:hypothetical protein
MHAVVHAADVQDRDGGVLLMGTIFGLYPFLLKLYANGGYQGAAFQLGIRKVFGAMLARRGRSSRTSLSRLRTHAPISTPSSPIFSPTSRDIFL